MNKLLSLIGTDIKMLILFLNMIDSPEGKGLFEAYYYEYRRLMLKIAYDELHDYQLAEDAVIEAFAKIAKVFEKQIERIKKQNIKTNLTASDIICPQMKRFSVVVTKNTCIDMNRKRNSRPEELCDDALDFSHAIDNSSENINPEIEYFNNYSVNEIKSAIKELNDTLKETMYLYVVEQLDRNEIAALLDISYDSVKKRIQRAQIELKKRLNN